MNSKTLALIARVLFALPFIGFAFGHFTNADMMAAMVPIAGGKFWVFFTGAAMIAGAVSVISGKMGMYGALGLSAMMIVFVLTIHLPLMMSENEGMKMMGMMGVFKDTMIAGGGFALASHFSKS